MKKKTKNNNKKYNNNTEPLIVKTAPRRDNFTVAQWRTAIKQAEMLQRPSRVMLYDIYNEMLLDTHLSSVIDKRRDSLRASRITFTENGKPNDKINDLCSMPWFRQMLVDILDSRFFGYTASWLDLSGGEFRKYKRYERKHVLPKTHQLTTKQGEAQGLDFSVAPYNNYIITAGEEDDLGLIIKAVVWVMFKRGNISDWATFNEIFAMPYRVGKYPSHDNEAKKAIVNALDQMGSAQWSALPDNCKLDFVQNVGSGNTTAYLSFADFCDKQLSKLFLRNTLTTDAEGGKYKGDIHASSEQLVLHSDINFVLDFLNDTFVKLLDVHGFNPGKGLFSCVEEEKMSLKERINIDTKLSSLIEIPASYFYERYGIPTPEGGAKRKEKEPKKVNSKDKKIQKLQQQISDLEKLPIEKTSKSFFR